MILEEFNDVGLVDLQGFSPESQAARSKGLHLSTIISKLRDRLIAGTARRASLDSSAVLVSPFIEAGILWEPVLEEGLRRKYATFRPEEIISPEGIAMSPDGFNPERVCGEEYKWTWKSCRGGLVDEYGMPRDKFLPWFWQIEAYAKWMGVQEFILRVFFVNGDYSRGPGGGPQFKSYLLTFSDGELEENWRMIVNVAREEGLLK